MKNKLYIVLFILIVVVPVGLLSENPAWGEWGNSYYQKILGFVPSGIKNAHTIQAPMADYSIHGVNDIVGYYLSAIVGLLALYIIFYLLTKFISKKKNEHGSL